MTKYIDKKRSIGMVAQEIGVQTHVIRFWGKKFPQITPEIGKGERRYYFDKDVQILEKIKSLLYDNGYTISGLQKLLNKRNSPDIVQSDLELLRINNLSDSSNKAGIDNDDDTESQFTPLDDGKKSSIRDIVSQIEDNLNKLQILISIQK